jgi:hypothetical protein
VTNIYHENAGEPQSKAYREIDLDKSKSEYETNGLTLSWDISDSLTIRSLTGYRKLDWRTYQDFAEAFGFISTTSPDFFLQPVPITFVSDNAVDSPDLG